MLKIGEFSKLAQVSPKTLRLYDDRGLLKPAWIDRFTGYRYYQVAQLAELNRILAYKDLGFSLDQITALLADDLPTAELRGMIRLKRAQLEQQIKGEQARLARIEARLQQIEQEQKLPDYEVVLKQIPPLLVAGIREKAPSLARVAPLFEDLQRFLMARAAPLPAAAHPLSIYYDAVFREHGLDLEVALPLDGPIAGGGPVRVHELPGVETMACVLHRGPYQQVAQAYQAIVHWVDSSGYQITGPNRDLFLQLPLPAAGAEQTVTEVQFPIRPRPYLSIVPSFKEHKKMEVTITSKPAFTVAGMAYFGKNEKGEIPKLWETFNQQWQDLSAKVNPDVCYGVCGEMEADGRFRYLAGFEVQPGSEQPPHMSTWDMPQQTYAVFPCTLQTIHETYQYAFQTWLPDSDYEHSPGPDFELYHDDFDPQAGSGMSIYIPVKKKAE